MRSLWIDPWVAAVLLAVPTAGGLAAETESVAVGRNQREIARIEAASARYPLRHVFTADTAIDRNTVTRRETMFKSHR
jgi:hypothetical protein